jgi:phosphoglycerate dehydrogenase-like enzyme
MSAHGRSPRCAVSPQARPFVTEATLAGGADLVPLSDAEALIWDHSPAALLRDTLRGAGPDLRWVCLPSAGIDRYLDVVTDQWQWTAAKGVYADPVAELALALTLAGLRNLVAYARSSGWSKAVGTNLAGANVLIVGGGGIGRRLVSLLRPFGPHITVVRRTDAPVEGAADVRPASQLMEVLPGADVVILAAAATPRTARMMAAEQFAVMRPSAWLVNVARGQLVDTDDLTVALREGQLGGAALDVTDPEPLPDGHPLWTLGNCLITPHAGNTLDMHRPLLMSYITENVRRFGAGEQLLGIVDPLAGY